MTLQDIARKKIQILNEFSKISYNYIAKEVEIEPKYLYAWIRGGYDLREDKYRRILSIINRFNQP